MILFLSVVGFIVIAWLIYSFFLKRKKLSVKRPGKRCSLCGAESTYEYSENAVGETKNVKPLCTRCLVSQLNRDYAAFSARAVVIQPVPGLPCYGFHSNQEWGISFKESKMDDDSRAHLSNMDPHCRHCGQEAHFLWIESRGLTIYNFGSLLRKGFSETLLPRNPKPISLCAKCCVGHIAEGLKEKELQDLEVSGPRGGEDGFIVSTGLTG